LPEALTVSVVNVATVVALRLSTPVAALVKAVTVPVPLILNVRLLVTVVEVVVPVPERLTIPLLVRVVTEQVPPRFSVPDELLLNVPVPARAVLAVNVPLFVNTMVVTVTLGIVVVVLPPTACALVENVCTPVLAVNVVALFVMPLAKVIAAAAVSFHTAPLFSVTAPVNVLAPVALLKVMVPVMLVVPETARVKPPTVRADPVAILRFVQAAAAVTVTVHPPSIIALSAATGAEAPGAPPEVADQVEVAFQLPDATE